MIPLLLWLSFSHRFNDSPMNWYTANNFCKRMKAKLLEIDSGYENREIWKEIRGRGFNQQKKQFWLGLTDRRREGQWVYESTGRVFLHWCASIPCIHVEEWLSQSLMFWRFDKDLTRIWNNCQGWWSRLLPSHHLAHLVWHSLYRFSHWTWLVFVNFFAEARVHQLGSLSTWAQLTWGLCLHEDQLKMERLEL